jgi:hypothetical protein
MSRGMAPHVGQMRPIQKRPISQIFYIDVFTAAKGEESERCLRNRSGDSKRGLSDVREQAVGTPPISLEPAPLRNSLWRGQERSTMCEKSSQILDWTDAPPPQMIKSRCLLIFARRKELSMGYAL